MLQKKGERGHVLEEVLASMKPEELGEQGADNLASLWLPREIRRGLIFGLQSVDGLRRSLVPGVW